MIHTQSCVVFVMPLSCYVMEGIAFSGCLWDCLSVCLSVYCSVCLSVHASQTLLTQYLEKYWNIFSPNSPLVQFGTRMNASVFVFKRSRSQRDQGPSRRRHMELDVVCQEIRAWHKRVELHMPPSAWFGRVERKNNSECAVMYDSRD